MSYKSPVNKQEYWAIVDTYWSDINHILNMYLNTFSDRWIDGSKLEISLGEYLIELKETRNPRLVRALHSAWWSCPEENAGEWQHPNWNKFVSLCLEEWCLIEERELECE